MKHSIYNKIIATFFLACSFVAFSSCIDETEPKNNTMTEVQVQNSSESMSALANGIAGKFSTIGGVNSSSYFDIGYPGLGIVRDQLLDDMPVYKSDYDYYNYWGSCTYLGSNYSTAYFPWNFYYGVAANCNILLRFQMTEKNKPYFGIAHFFRAWSYFDLARMYEYKTTGIKELDAKAESNGIYGLTVPVIRENTTEEEARNTPRLTTSEMYSFILADLDTAEVYLKSFVRSKKNLPDLSVVYGEKARVYLDMATRLDNETSLADFKASGAKFSENITSAEDCYKLAKKYAQSAIDASGCQVLTETQWYGGGSYTEGFNNINIDSWMLGSILTKDNITTSWKNFVSFLAPETTYGMAGLTTDGTFYNNTYKAQRLISNSLYQKISDKDWRKATWIDPSDAGKKSAKASYKTNVTEAQFAQYPALTGFKFRPASGEMTDYSVASCGDYPMMRVEEMYFIKFEAMYHVDGVSAAKAAFASFMKNNRWNGEDYEPSDGDFITDLMTQKKVEFWGEGIMYFDYKRLNLDVNRSDAGNYPSAYMLDAVKKSATEYYTPCWFNFYIPTKEVGLNKAMTDHANPDPSGLATKRGSSVK